MFKLFAYYAKKTYAGLSGSFNGLVGSFSNERDYVTQPVDLTTNNRGKTQVFNIMFNKNYLKGFVGDQNNAVLAAIGYNMRMILRKARIIFGQIYLKSKNKIFTCYQH